VQVDEGACPATIIGHVPAASHISPSQTSIATPISTGQQQDLPETRQSSGYEYNLICNIDASAIENRWLNAFIPEPGQRPKYTSPAVTAYVGRILKAYTAGMIRHGHLPPFIHPGQLDPVSVPSSLHRCFTMVGVCGKGDRGLAAKLVEDELASLTAERTDMDPNGLLQAFQAYLIYVIILYFHLDQQDSAVLRHHMINLQQLASETCAQGTIDIAELEQTRPRWLSWIHVEAKRRTLITMYLFDNLLCVRDRIPVLVATELTGLLSAASKYLWQASSEDQWKTAYNTHVADWNEGGLHLEELWRPPPNSSKEVIQRRQGRIDHWLEDADEFCLLLYAVTSNTHGD
jgi:hypothetical protein